MTRYRDLRDAGVFSADEKEREKAIVAVAKSDAKALKVALKEEEAAAEEAAEPAA